MHALHRYRTRRARDGLMCTPGLNTYGRSPQLRPMIALVLFQGDHGDRPYETRSRTESEHTP